MSVLINFTLHGTPSSVPGPHTPDWEVLVIRRHLSSRFLALAALLTLVPTAGTRVAGQTSPGAQARVVALSGATILTVTKGTIPERHHRPARRQDRGRRRQRGHAGRRRSDRRDGKFISPGLIDAHSHIANDAINEGGTTVSSMTGMEDVLDPTDVNIYREPGRRPDDIANMLHGSANPIGGKNAVIKLRWGKTSGVKSCSSRARMPGIKFALGENPKDMTQPGAGQHGSAPVSGDAHGRRVRHPRRVHAREGLPEGVAATIEKKKAAGRTRCRRAATCSSSRSSRFSRASGSCTRTATAPTRS